MVNTSTRSLLLYLFLMCSSFQQDLCAQTPVKQTSRVPPKKISFSIEGSLQNITKKAVVHLAWEEPWTQGEFLKADVIGGKFLLSGEMSQPSSGHIRIVTYNDSGKAEQNYPWDCDMRSFFICAGKTTIEGTDSLSTSKIVSGCPENGLLQSLDSLLAPILKEKNGINSALQQAYITKDTCSSKTLEKSLSIARYKEEQVYQTFILDHPTSYLSVNLLNALVYPATDKRKLRLYKAVSEKLSPRVKSSPLMAGVRERIDQRLYPLAGTAMPALTLKNENGVPTDIRKFRGKVLLIDFWASWCVPCRKEFPKLLSLYEKYKDQGFEILGISIDEKTESWKEAIKKDKLAWPQFIDEGATFGGKASRLYKVTGVPAKFLVNKDGVIVAADVSMDQLENRLKTVLNIADTK